MPRLRLLTSNLATLGVASLEWMLLRQSLLHLLPGVPIPAQLLFDAPSIAELSQQLQRLQCRTGPEAVPDSVAPQRPEVASQPDDEPPAGTPATVHPTAVLREDVTIGEGCVIGEHAIVGPRVRLGVRCRIAAMAIVEEDVTLGEDCEVSPRALLRGPLSAGRRNRFDEGCLIGCHSSHLGAVRNGCVRIGDGCLFELSSAVLAPRGLNGQPGVTHIGNGVVVHLKAEVSHDCVLEDGVFLNGELSGFCHLMAGAKVAKGAILHQFTTVGTSSFCAMMTKVRHDVLPFCVLDDVLLIDRVALSRQGKSAQEAEELDQFYTRHFSSQAAPYIQSIDSLLPEDTKGPWFGAEIQRFFRIRSQMRDRRPLARYGVAPEPRAPT